MKKRILKTIVATCMTAMMFVGCASNNTTNEDKTTENTLSLENNRLRQNIKLKYGVNVGYKDEIDGVYVSDYVKPVKQYDDEKINKILNTIDSSLKKYPNNFFFEISKK